MPDAFTHKPLYDSEQIRLFQICLQDGCVLQLRIEHHELTKCPSFTALSYEWGRADHNHQIIIEGASFTIRSNLWSLLQELRRKCQAGELSHDMLFWNDAICINQSDMIEKNTQVSLMGQIYHSAETVFAWLRIAHEESAARVFHFIRDGNTLLGGLTSAALWAKLQPAFIMCSCRYWTRRWILQELLLADRVIIGWGRALLSWEDFLKFTLCFPITTTNVGGQSLARVASIEQKLRRTVPFRMANILRQHGDANHRVRCTLPVLLNEFHETRCEVPHDRIYSLMSLVEKGGRVRADYRDTLIQLLAKVLGTRHLLPRDEILFLADESADLNKSGDAVHRPILETTSNAGNLLLRSENATSSLVQ